MEKYLIGLFACDTERHTAVNITKWTRDARDRGNWPDQGHAAANSRAVGALQGTLYCGAGSVEWGGEGGVEGHGHECYC